MITNEKISFKAAKTAPSPKETDYWIDLTEDLYGNVIKSYSGGVWLPLNTKANANQFGDIYKLVDLLGFERNEDGTIIIPEDSNVYFTGSTILDMLESGDTALNGLIEQIEGVDEDLQEFKGTKAQPGGIASLNDEGKVPDEQLPSWTDDVVEVYATYHVDETGKLSNIKVYEDADHTIEINPGETGKIYVNITGENDPWLDEEQAGDAKYKNIPYQFRWSGSQYVHIDNNALILGEVTGTAFDGKRGKDVETTVNSVDKLVKEITDAFVTDTEKAQLKYQQGVKNEETGIFEYAEHNAELPAASETHAGVMTAEQYKQLATAATIPSPLVTQVQLDQTDTDKVTIISSHYTKGEDGVYLQDEQTELEIAAASATQAGVMTAADYTALHTTLPNQLATETEERKKADNVIETNLNNFKEKATEYKTKNDADIAELKEHDQKTKSAVGLQEDYTLPDLSEYTYIKDSVSVIGAAEKLDKELEKVNTNADELWYGVKFNFATNSSPDGIRTGNLNMHKELPVQSRMRGCIIDGSSNTNNIKYLDPEDWSKYEGGEEVGGLTGDENYFVEIPDHYRLFLQTAENDIEIRLSLYNLPGYHHVERKYISAYEATELTSETTNKKLYSRPGGVPTVSKSRGTFQTEARQSRTNNWNIYTYDAHVDLTWLFVVEYATTNSQKAFNKDLTPEGYHQGGLGEGVTNIGTVESNTYSFVLTGTTDDLANSTGIVEYTDAQYYTSRTFKVPRYRGIENPFGHIWKNLIDVVLSGTENGGNCVYVCKDYTQFNTTITTNNFSEDAKKKYIKQPFTDCAKNGYLKELVGTNFGDLFCKECIGDSIKYYCDYHWQTNHTNSNAYTLLIGCSSAHGADAGLFSLNSGLWVDHSYGNVGTRLTFYGEPTDTKAAAAKAMAYASQPNYDMYYGFGMSDEEYDDMGTHSDSYTMNDDETII